MIVEIDMVPVALPASALEFLVQNGAPVFYAFSVAAPDPADGGLRAYQGQIVKTGANHAGGPLCWVWSSAPTRVFAR